MRLGLYIPVLDQFPAGVGTYTEQICSRLISSARSTVVFTSTQSYLPSWLSGVTVRPFGRKILPQVNLLNGPRRRLRRLLWLNGQCNHSLAKEKVDILYSPVQESPFSALIPSVITVHDITPLKYPSSYDPLTVLQTRWLLPRMLQHASSVVSVSHHTKQDILQTFNVSPSKIFVVGEGYDRSTFYPRSTEECKCVMTKYSLKGRYLLYAGTFAKHKNLLLLLQALSNLTVDFPDLSLVLVGRTDTGEYLSFRNAVEHLKLSAKVSILGYVSRNDLAILMSRASAFLYPSTYEGFGLAPLEAMACGTQVIASKVASLTEVVGSGGILVDTNTQTAWSSAIRNALLNDCSKVSSSAILNASRFDWDDAAESINSIIRRSLA